MFHINQAYDLLVANHNKMILSETLAYQRQIKYLNKDVIDKYQLIHTAISTVKKMPR